MDLNAGAGSPNESEETTLTTCKNCSNRFNGKFCNRCGEKVIEDHERSILFFLEGVLHAITHAEGKIFRNLKYILINPGFISKNYVNGIRQPYMKLIPMFFVANLIYFLFLFFQTFNTNLSSQINSQSYSSMIRPIVEKKMAKENISFETLAIRYNTKTSSYSKLLLIVFVPAFAVVFAILNYKRERYFADHIIMSLEFMCFTLFYNTIFLGFIMNGIEHITRIPMIEHELLITVPFIMLSTFYFLFRCERTFYQQKIVWAALKSIVFILASAYVVTGYRLLLFFVTINTV
jgi:hypothetical protein